MQNWLDPLSHTCRLNYKLLPQTAPSTSQPLTHTGSDVLTWRVHTGFHQAEFFRTYGWARPLCGVLEPRSSSLYFNFFLKCLFHSNPQNPRPWNWYHSSCTVSQDKTDSGKEWTLSVKKLWGWMKRKTASHFLSPLLQSPSHPSLWTGISHA